MKPSPLSWIVSSLTLQSVSPSSTRLKLKDLPNELQHTILISENVDFCDYVRSVDEHLNTCASPEVENIMLAKVAEEERGLNLYNDDQRARKQRILKSIRAFVRLHSELPTDWKTTSTEERGHWAKVFESSYEDCASYSESPTWKKACMAGLFGGDNLMTLLPYLSDDFRLSTKEILLRTSVFVGDIDSLKAIVDFFGISKKGVLKRASARDLVFSGSMPFVKELFEFLPNLMSKRLDLIREASSLNRLDILTRILKVAERVELDNLDQILDSLCRLKMFKYEMLGIHSTNGKVGQILQMAAWYGHLPIIRFLWPAMEVKWNGAEYVVRDMMTGASGKNHRGVLEFLLWQSGFYYMNVAQYYVNNAFEAAVGEGRVEIIQFLTGKDNNGKFVAPGLGLTTLNSNILYMAIRINRKWNGLESLAFLKQSDPRFAEFELVDQDNIALLYACEAGNYELVEYLLQKAPSGEFVFPLTNPVVQDNQPLVNACSGGNLLIVKKFLERDLSGDYVYKGIDPSAQNYKSVVDACRSGCEAIVRFLLKMGDGKYILPEMEGVDLTDILLTLIRQDRIEIVRFLLEMKDGKYVLLEMESVNIVHVLLDAINRNRMDIIRLLLKMEDGKYVLPQLNGVNLTCALSAAIKCSCAYRDLNSVKFLLRKSPDGSYLLPGVKVTEDMLTIVGQSPEMGGFLEKHLEQQRGNM